MHVRLLAEYQTCAPCTRTLDTPGERSWRHGRARRTCSLSAAADERSCLSACIGTWGVCARGESARVHARGCMRRLHAPWRTWAPAACRSQRQCPRTPPTLTRTRQRHACLRVHTLTARTPPRCWQLHTQAVPAVKLRIRGKLHLGLALLALLLAATPLSRDEAAAPAAALNGAEQRPLVVGSQAPQDAPAQAIAVEQRLGVGSVVHCLHARPPLLRARHSVAPENAGVRGVRMSGRIMQVYLGDIKEYAGVCMRAQAEGPAATWGGEV